MFEVEQKFHVPDVEELRSSMDQMGLTPVSTEQHVDAYYNHPSRDFAQTQEALRVRRVNGVPYVTYKGKKLPGDVKARRELEWHLSPGDPEGENMESLLKLLGFTNVAQVKKRRDVFQSPAGQWEALTAVIDQVEGLGTFAELEWVVADESGVEAARTQIRDFAAELGLDHTEHRSYLRMLLELHG
ncbi:CYTH domain protein [Planctomycetes bacterium CA13]|uniref:CYTH domain protein n=1 Tax=Novipirellula herctigrandis TaxID=2527986 RepID=A0A5C5YWY8_9BACT|nr:CYTH domain protein [Planctomycetes bacterium CA13]